MAKKKNASKAMVYFIAAIMLLSAFFMGGRINDTPPESDDTLGRVLEYGVSLVGESSTQVTVSSGAKDVIAMPTDTRYLSGESLANVLENSLSIVGNSSFEHSKAFALFRFNANEGFNNVSEITSLLDGEIRGYTLYRSYDADAGGTLVELVGSTDLKRGDVVRAFLFRRSDNNRIIAIQESKVEAGGDSTAPEEVAE